MTAAAPAMFTTAAPSTRKALLVCGIVSSVLYVLINVAGALRWEDYNSASQTISELSAIGAPSRPLVVALGLMYDALLVAFGIGVWKSAAARRGLRVAGAMLIAIGLLGPFWPPMHLRGSVTTLTDTLHIVFTAVVGLLTLLAVGFASTAFGRWFRVYSLATIAALVVFGALAGLDGPRVAANLPTPWVGVTERINLGAYVLWVGVLAAVLLHEARGRANGSAHALPPDADDARHGTCLAVLVLAAACGCAQPTGPLPVVTSSAVPVGVAKASTRDTNACPLGVEGARIAVADVDGGVELTITSDVDRVEEVRDRARDAAALHGIGIHRGRGHDGHHLGAHRHGLRLTDLPPVKTSVEDVDGGARIRLVALVPEHVEALREQAREHVEAASKPPCES